jgi:hypothetical protein
VKRVVAFLLVLACLGPQVGFLELPGFPGPEPCPLEASSDPHEGEPCSPFCPTCGCCMTQAFTALSPAPRHVSEPPAEWVAETRSRVITAPPVDVWHVPLA